MADYDSKSAATHFILSRVIDLWMEGKPDTDKTDLMNHLIHSMNFWLEWKYGPGASEYTTRPTLPYPKRPECLKGGQLDTRIWNAMVNGGHMTLEDMSSHADYELLRAPNFGRKSLKRMRELAAEERVRRLIEGPAE
jgi:DNA-directed RNA polymerase alpha subunit